MSNMSSIRFVPAVQNCIGRYTGGDWAKGTKPCNYAAYGLFHLSTVVVLAEDGTETQAFGFDGWPQSAHAVESQPVNDSPGKRQQKAKKGKHERAAAKRKPS